MKKEDYPVSGKEIVFDLEKYKGNPFLILSLEEKAKKCGWQIREIRALIDFLKGKTYEEQLAILQHYCIEPLPNSDGITQEDVAFLCEHQGHIGHYLASKEIEVWDNYDWANYGSIQKKATRRLVRRFAIFDKNVKEEDKYRVTSPPGIYFETREQAQSYIAKDQLQTTIIYSLWIEE